eukprot:scaffold23805_cov88-Skeletonema_marinoi.AAC.1
MERRFDLCITAIRRQSSNWQCRRYCRIMWWLGRDFIYTPHKHARGYLRFRYYGNLGHFSSLFVVLTSIR